jgi:hypothetical protein
MAETRVVQGYIDPNFPNPMTESSATIIIYGCVSTVPKMEEQDADSAIRYTPSLAVGVLGVVLFAIGLAAHLFLLLRHRTWYFSTVVVGTVMEIVGYAFRILSSQQNPYSVPWFVVQVRFGCSTLTYESRANGHSTSSSSSHQSSSPRRYTPSPPS